MDKSALVSFIIAAYNEEEHIVECIESCLNQTHSNTEVCVTDDGSTDATWRVLEQHYSANTKVKLRRFDCNRGKVAAFNISYAAASGDYIAIIGADDINYPYRVEKQLEYLKQYDLVCSDLDQVANNNSAIVTGRLVRKAFGTDCQRQIHFDELLTQPKVFGPTILLKRQLADKIFPLPETLPHEDWYIPLLSAYYGRVYFIDEPLVRYRSHKKYKAKSLGYSKWRARLTRELPYYELLTNFLRAEQSLGHLDYLAQQIIMCRLVESDSLLRRLDYLRRLKDLTARQWITVTLCAMSPYIPYLRCRLREAVESSRISREH